jgi:predicted dehydrogenase
MTAQPLTVGVIGCGVIGPVHAECFALLDDVRLIGACDLEIAKARKLADKFDVSHVTTDYRELLADASLDAVTICTDHASHAPIAAEALRAGKHVLCEKALAANAEGLEQMFAAHAEAPGQVFAGIFQHRFEPVNRYVRRLVAGGKLGQLLTAGVQVRCLRTAEYYQADRWRGTWGQEGGSTMINQAIHFIDLLQWIAGGVDRVVGVHQNLTHGDVIETEDTAAASLVFACGALGTLEATSSSHLGWECTLSFHGTAGSIEIRNDKPIKVEFDDADLQAEVAQGLANCGEAEGPGVGKIYYGSGHPANIADFVAAIREGRPPFVTAASTRHTVELILGIYESHRTGQWVELTPRVDAATAP